MPRCNVPSIRIGEAELYDKVVFAIWRPLSSPAFDGYLLSGGLPVVHRREEVLLHSKALFARDAFADNPDGLLGFGLMPLVDEHCRIDHYNAKWNDDENEFRPVRKESSHIPDPISRALKGSHNRHSAPWTLLFRVIHRYPEAALSARPLIYAPLDYRVSEQQRESNEYGQE
jgi:hypothetical protein